MKLSIYILLVFTAFGGVNLVYSSPMLKSDSLIWELNNCNVDSVKYKLLNSILEELNENKPHEALTYANQLLVIANQSQKQLWIAKSYYQYASILFEVDDYESSLFHFFKALNIFENLNDSINQALCLNKLGLIYWKTDDVVSAKRSYFQAFDLLKNTEAEVYKPLLY